MRIAVIMDPIESVHVDKDTSFALMLEAQSRGHEVSYLSYRDLWIEGDTLRATVRPVKLRQENPPLHASVGAPQDVDVAALDAVLVRTEPPFDRAYAYTTLLHEMVRNKVLVMNDPRGLRDANE